MLRVPAGLVICSFLIPAPIHAQSATAADLEGTVTDPAGGTISGAELVATNIETGSTRQGTTNSLGLYRIPALAAGSYKLRISKTGFAGVERQGLTLQIGQVVTLDIQLPVAAQAQEVTISAAAPIVETGRASVGAVINRAEIDNLPTNGRNFLDFSRTVAGVTGQQTSGQGSGISFNGQRGRSNNIVIDGATGNGQLNGNTRLTMSQDAVREFQVVTNQFAPEFGNAGGGLVNIVSRSGTNEYHGNLFLFARNEALDARNAFVTDKEKPPFRRKNSGATLGGPILRNRTFFFAAVEYINRNESDVVTIPDEAVRTINATLAAHPIPNAGVRSVSNGTFPVDRITTLASLKLDHSFNVNNSAVFRYLYGQARDANAGGVGIGGLTDVSGGGGMRTRDQSFLGSFTHIFTPALLGETRFQFAPRRLAQYDNDPIGPRITISGVANFGRNINFPVLLDEASEQVQQDLSWQRGRHFFKFGADINRIRAHTSFPVSFGGSFSFASLPDFVAGRVNQFTQGFGDPQIELPETLVGFYAQDSFKVHEKLTLAYGLRYDYDMQPQGIRRDRNNPIEAALQTGIHRDANNVAPRFALTFNPDGKGKTLIRTGYGLFYDKIFLLVARNALLARQTITLASGPATAQLSRGTFPQSRTFPSGVALPKPSLNTVDPNIVIPYAQQANFGIERELAANWVAGADYVLVRGVKLLRSQNLNLGPPTLLTPANAPQLGIPRPNAQQLGRLIFGTNNRLNPDFTNIQQVSSSGSSTYHGLRLSLRKRFSQGFQLRANYTLSKAIDDGSDFVQAQQPSNPYNGRAERALSTEDQRHRFTLTGVWELPYRRAPSGNTPARWIFGDWSIATLWVLRSGTPQNVTVGSDVNLDGNSNDRPFNGTYELGRNTYRGPGFRSIDVRLSKRIQFREKMYLQFLAEAFNVENRVNYSDVNTTWGTELAARPSFGQFLAANDPRQIQIGVKFQY